MRTLVGPALLLVIGVACVDLEDPAGRRCDLAHPCAAGRECIDGFCKYPDPSRGPDAGRSDAGSVNSPGALLFMEDFEAYPQGAWPEGSTHGTWYVSSAGGGSVAVAVNGTRTLDLETQTATFPGERYVARAATAHAFSDVDLRIRMRALPAFGSDPDPLVAVEWRVQDENRSYVMGLTLYGWILGKRTATGVQELAAGNMPFIQEGTWAELRVVHVSEVITAFVNDVQVADVTDTVAPHESGAIALSARQGQGHFDDLRVLAP